jgi:hypothetical protein
MQAHTSRMILMMLLAATPVLAQMPGGDRRGGMDGEMGGRRGMMRPGMDGAGMVTEGEVAGPPTAVALQQVVELSADQVTSYESRWNEHMAATATPRDSARAALHGIGAARESADREMMRHHAEALRRLASTLQKRDREFEEKQLEPLPTKEQKKAFDKWQDARKKEADAERERRREEMREQ